MIIPLSKKSYIKQNFQFFYCQSIFQTKKPEAFFLVLDFALQYNVCTYIMHHNVYKIIEGNEKRVGEACCHDSLHLNIVPKSYKYSLD